MKETKTYYQYSLGRLREILNGDIERKNLTCDDLSSVRVLDLQAKYFGVYQEEQTKYKSKLKRKEEIEIKKEINDLYKRILKSRFRIDDRAVPSLISIAFDSEFTTEGLTEMQLRDEKNRISIYPLTFIPNYNEKESDKLNNLLIKRYSHALGVRVKDLTKIEDKIPSRDEWLSAHEKFGEDIVSSFIQVAPFGLTTSEYISFLNFQEMTCHLEES